MVSAWLVGPALAVKRYGWSLGEIAKIPRHRQLAERQLQHLRGFSTRVDMIGSFGKGGSVAEIGVAAGAFSRRILDTAEPDRLFLIDHWKSGRHAHGFFPKGKGGQAKDDLAVVEEAFAREIATGRVKLLRGTSWEMASTLDDRSLDWVYLDAGHDFDSITRDLEAVLPKMKPGGIIAGHDYVRWGRHGYRCGVIEAVTEVCMREDWGLVGLTFEANYPPSFAIAPL
jgi:hypothetical protein